MCFKIKSFWADKVESLVFRFRLFSKGFDGYISRNRIFKSKIVLKFDKNVNFRPQKSPIFIIVVNEVDLTQTGQL